MQHAPDAQFAPASPATRPHTAPTIRPAIKADVAVIRKCTRTTHETHARHLPHRFAVDDAAEAFAEILLANAFRSPGGTPIAQSETLFVAESDGQFCGYIHLSNSPEEGCEIGIVDIYAAPEFRGIGVGTALLRHAQRLCEEADVHSLHAEVWNGNEASAALFAAAQFREDGKMYSWGKDTYPDRPPPPGVWTIKTFATGIAVGLGGFLALIGLYTVLSDLLT